MTSTIPNVPRELLERAWRALANSATGREIGAYLDADPCAPECSETCARASMCSTCSATLSSPSPAGVDGLEVIGWYTEDHLDDKSATTYSREVADRWLAKGWSVTGIANESDAKAIIDGLQEKIERLQFSLEVAKTDELSAAVYAETESIKHSLWNAEKECDQHAQRIGELEGLLREAYKYPLNHACETVDFTAQDLCERIDAALSAGKEGE